MAINYDVTFKYYLYYQPKKQEVLSCMFALVS